jgi:transcriptional regulator with XRE-family HTH domain
MPSSDPHASSIGALIRQLRDERGWTQARLANQAGITITCLSNLERGATHDPNIETIAGLAAAFGLQPSELDPRRLGEIVTEQARSFAQRKAITRLLALSNRDVEAALVFLDERSKRKRRTK